MKRSHVEKPGNPKVYKSYRSRIVLQNEYFLSKIGANTVENELSTWLAESATKRDRHANNLTRLSPTVGAAQNVNINIIPARP